MSRPLFHETDVTIGQALRSMRLLRTYTQADIAAALGVTRTAVTHYESGTRSLHAAQLVLVAHVLDCAVEQLLPSRSGHAATLMEESGELTGPIAQIVHILNQRPDLIVNVLDLLETMLQLSASDDVTEQPIMMT